MAGFQYWHCILNLCDRVYKRRTFTDQWALLFVVVINLRDWAYRILTDQWAFLFVVFKSSTSFSYVWIDAVGYLWSSGISETRWNLINRFLSKALVRKKKTQFPQLRGNVMQTADSLNHHRNQRDFDSMSRFANWFLSKIFPWDKNVTEINAFVLSNQRCTSIVSKTSPVKNAEHVFL